MYVSLWWTCKQSEGGSIKTCPKARGRRLIILVLPIECWNNSQLLQLNPLQLNRSAKACQFSGTKIRWRTEQLFVGVTRMSVPSVIGISKSAHLALGQTVSVWWGWGLWWENWRIVFSPIWTLKFALSFKSRDAFPMVDIWQWLWRQWLWWFWCWMLWW